MANSSTSSSSSSSFSSSSEVEGVQTRSSRGQVRTRGGSSRRGTVRTRGGLSGSEARPGPGKGKPASLVRGGKTRPPARGSKGSSGSSGVVELKKKQTAQGPKRKRSVVQFEERQTPRTEAEVEPAAGTEAEAEAETETEAPSSKRPKKRTPKKKVFASDVRYGGPFGGAADFFGWEPSVAEKEKMPCTEGTAKSQPMRTKRMQDMEGVTTPYLMRPAEIAIRREDVEIDFLGRGGCSLTDSRIKFYATFLAPTRQLGDPHD